MTIGTNRHFHRNNGLTTGTYFVFFRVTDDFIRSAGSLIEQMIGRFFLH